MNDPQSHQRGRSNSQPELPISDLAATLWVVAVLLTVVLVAHWYFAAVFSSP
jgi:hypothetical protein